MANRPLAATEETEPAPPPVRRAARPRAVGWRFALAWHVASIGLALIFALGITLFDPFNMDQGLAERGREWFYRVAAFSYPARPSGPPSMVPPGPFIVTADDAFLDFRKISWPIPYKEHVAVLDEIASRSPAAIFMDMSLIDARNDPDVVTLCRLLASLSETVPIYLAAAPPARNVPVARPEVLQLVAEHPNIRFVSIVNGRSLGVGTAYPLSPYDGKPPAALQIYNDLVAPALRVSPRSRDDEMDIWWAIPRDRFNCRGDPKAACGQLEQGALARLAQLLFLGISPQPDRSRDPGQIEVPFAPTISATDLFKGDATADVNPEMAGRVVFYGSNVAMTGDIHQSPLQGPLPGVHVHAMAYDNLVTLKGRYVSAEPPIGLSGRAHALALILILGVGALAARLAAIWMKPSLNLQPHLQTGSFRALDATVLIGLTALIVIVEFNVLRVGPGAWAPMLLAALTGDLFATRGLTRLTAVRLLRRSRTAKLAVRPKPRWRR